MNLRFCVVALLVASGAWAQYSPPSGGAGGGGSVASVFGRTGTVAATTGDYTAAQVTNAVDSTNAYSNPGFVASLAYAKLTGGPTIPTVTGGTCTNQVVTAISNSVVPTCGTITNAYIDASIVPSTRIVAGKALSANVTIACADLSNAGTGCSAALAAVATSGSASDLPTGTLPAARLPNPSASTLGGVQSKASASHQFLNAISTSGVPGAGQPVCADLSDAGTGCSSPAGAMVLISDQVVGSAVATVTFSSIPGTYSSLKLIMTSRCSSVANADNIYIQANGDTTSTYTSQYIVATQTTVSAAFNAASNKSIFVGVPCASATSNQAGSSEVTFTNYSSTVFNKQAIGSATYGSDNSGRIAWINAGWNWASTAAISSLTIGLVSGGNFITGSRLTLYGIN